jgi:hypothetical protein
MRVRRTLAALLAAPLLLSACGRGGSSVADPPVSSAPSSARSTQPPEHESPEHFIRRFYSEERQMENSGETSAYSAMASECRPCSSLVSQVRTFYRAGGYIRWAGLTIKSIDKFSTDTRPGSSYTIKFDARPTRYQESATSEVKTLPGGPSTDVLTLKKTHDSWMVVARARTAS